MSMWIGENLRAIAQRRIDAEKTPMREIITFALANPQFGY